MKKLYKILIFNTLIILIGCAKQSAPTGGPRDEDPPKLLSMNPEDQSLNTKPEEIILEFDEYIKLDNPNKNIIITPRINKDELIVEALKNQVTLELNQELEENTTYVFNFQKSIQDLSEGNPAENLKLVFSTGDQIDSLTLSGKVNIYYPEGNNDFEDILVGLYPIGDTTDLFTGPPYYISQTDSIGNYTINNIKGGDYRAFAWKDENNSLKAEYKSEQFDFIPDTISIQENLSNLVFNLSASDITEFRLQRSSFTNGSYDLIFNKNPLEIGLQHPDMGENIFYTTEDKRIKLFSTESRADSIAINLQLADSIGFTIDSSIWAKFPELDRQPDDLSYSANSGKSFLTMLEAQLTFNKPIMEINYDSLYIPIDSTNRIQIKPEMVSFKDSLKRNTLLFKIPIPDTLELQIYPLTLADSTFKDIQNQYNQDGLVANYRKIDPQTLGDEISGRINSENGPFIVRLITAKDELYRENYLENGSEFSFEEIEAGTYTIQVIEDKNGNRRWDPSNFYKNELAEKVYYYQNPENQRQEIIIKSGWTTEDLVIEPINSTGLNKKNPVDNEEIQVDNQN